MVVTRTTLMIRAARKLGAYTGTVTAGSTPANNAVLGGLKNVGNGDDSILDSRLLIFPDATAEADKERLIRRWEDADALAHFDVRSTDTDMATENFIVMPRDSYNLAELRDALNLALRETPRTYRYAIPLYNGQKDVKLTSLTWLKGDSDVDASWASDSPSLIHNADFGLWQDGDSAAPDGWTKSGDNSTIARAANGIRSSYAATLTRVTNDASLYQSVPPAYVQYLTRSTNAPLTALYAGAWVVCGTASRARIGISLDGGTTWTYSSYATGTASLPEWLTVTVTPTASSTDIRLGLFVDTGDVAATFHYADMVAGSEFPNTLRDHGRTHYSEYQVAHNSRNVGGFPEVELYHSGPRQLVTYSRRMFAEMDADSDEVDDQYARAIEAGMLAKLLQVRKPNQDRTRLDVIEAEERRIWTRLANNFNDLPVPAPPFQAVVRGA